MKRIQALEVILKSLDSKDLALFTTGMISREAFATRDRNSNFYMLGSMGLLSSLGLGLAIQRPKRRIVVIEGDGSFLMSMGTSALVAFLKPKNFIHIVLDNEAYDSTGGQATISGGVSLMDIPKASGYLRSSYAADLETLESSLLDVLREGPSFLQVKVELGGSEVGRVSIEPESIRDRFREDVLSSLEERSNKALI